ncbi:hypothetical protein GGX14DRAFT_408425 [Mycena pura]|uniref:Uncharacterized protein n=1 Tax=Mycena pura TaxID=153505 RepID=A0AAD6UQ57_9AGAR|nr:hypothetical protein GGX14DRAFT_408425 [Mycena pura]
MDPLKLSDLATTENWSAFKPSMKGYLQPQNLDLWPECEDIESQLRKFAMSYFIRDNDAPFLALSVSKGFPAMRLTISGETFVIPISPRDGAFLATHLGNGDALMNTVPAGEVTILSDAAWKSILSNNWAVLRRLKASEGDGGHSIDLEQLAILKAGSHQLATAAKDRNHYATIFVILPTFADSAEVRVRAAHDNVVSDVRLPSDLTQSACAVGVYAGVSDARIDVGAGTEVVCLTYHASVSFTGGLSVVPTLEYLSGAMPPLRDGFCLWRYRLDSGIDAPTLILNFLAHHPKSSRDFSGADATLLSHFAPLAKAYDFKMYIAEFHHTMSTTQEVDHPYKEYLGWDTDLDPSVLEMSDNPDIEYKCKNLRTLGGVRVKDEVLLKLAAELVTSDEYLQDQVMDLDPEEDDNVVDDTCYSATVIYSHRATCLIPPMSPGGVHVSRHCYQPLDIAVMISWILRYKCLKYYKYNESPQPQTLQLDKRILWTSPATANGIQDEANDNGSDDGDDRAGDKTGTQYISDICGDCSSHLDSHLTLGLGEFVSKIEVADRDGNPVTYGETEEVGSERAAVAVGVFALVRAEDTPPVGALGKKVLEDVAIWSDAETSNGSLVARTLCKDGSETVYSALSTCRSNPGNATHRPTESKEGTTNVKRSAAPLTVPMSAIVLPRRSVTESTHTAGSMASLVHVTSTTDPIATC